MKLQVHRLTPGAVFLWWGHSYVWTEAVADDEVFAGYVRARLIWDGSMGLFPPTEMVRSLGYDAQKELTMTCISSEELTPHTCPAPGCGREPGVLRDYVHVLAQQQWYVRCAPVCGYRGPYRKSKPDAIEAHNRLCGGGG